MAKTTKTTGKLSRRQMVALMGSGVVFAGTIRSEEIVAEAQQPCGPVQVYQTSASVGGAKRLLLVADMCCLDGCEVITAGRGGKPASSRAVKDLKPLDDTLAGAIKSKDLMEYCVMIWGLNAQQRDETVATLTGKYIAKK